MTTYRARIIGALFVGTLVLGCEPSRGPQTIDSQTNWLRSCEIDAQCDGLSCICGACTNPCTNDDGCIDLEGTACIVAAEAGAIAQCGGVGPRRFAGLCLPRCEDVPCASGQMCIAGVCAPVPETTATVSVDTAVDHQTLTGFGATLAYGEDQLVNHPQRSALFATAFGELGLDVLRLRNRYGNAGDDDLSITKELLDGAAASLGRQPTLLLGSWSPPAALKANADVQCSGNAATCTLTKTAGGAFDYAGYGAYWRDSLDAYAALGMVPDYVGIQNNPDWLPTSAESGQACVFLPTEGTTRVAVNGVMQNVQYPGYAEAQAATLTALDGLASLPKILAPDTSSIASVADYLAALDPATLDAIAHHLYGIDPEAPDVAAFQSVGDLASSNDLPVFQTEMSADGLGTAVLIHYTTAVEGGSAYLQQTLYSPSTGPMGNAQALMGVNATTFTLRDPYYALQHFARSTDPGWVRVDATVSGEGVLASAWRSPDRSALTVVLVNSGNTPIDAGLELPTDAPPSSTVTRTVFGGVERGAPLGELSAEGVLTVPPRSVVTVALTD